jgi:hypothetical protein
MFVPIEPRLPKAQDKTMLGVRHDINIICKMSSPMVKGILWGLPLSPSQKSWDPRTKNILL